ncbi:MAG TPA: dihydroxyacetone kinase phosphoryl donor subunit DhaM [Negativicutes bacterium]|nr:dihydroxyacetone kinase phosphoryl donor subunit DhaM [Negativicutes bacterium]
MVGLVIVSHSAKIAEGIREFALELTKPDQRILTAGGLSDGALGTDATRISAAIEAADSGDGVVVLVDLGSGVLSAETALEFLDPQQAARTRIADAPLVEGAIAAAVEASVGAPLVEVVQAAEDARELHKR